MESSRYYSGKNEAGFTYIEKRPTSQEDYKKWVEEFLAWGKERVREAGQNIAETIHDIRANKLSEKQTIELRRALGLALGISASIMAPNKQEAYGHSTAETHEASNAQVRIDLSDVPSTEATAETSIAIPTQETLTTQQFEAVADDSLTREVEHYFNWLQTDAANHFIGALRNASKPVVGAESMNRMEYIGQTLTFPEHPTFGALSEVTQEELRKIVPSLCIQESGYDNGLVSSTGAVGIMQIMPGTIADMSDYSTEEVQRSLMKQVEVAGKYFVSMRYTIFDSPSYGVGEKAMNELMRRHTEEEFHRDFEVPILINAYNAGPARMGGVIKAYFDVSAHMRNGLKGRDLYHDIIEWAENQKTGMAAGFGDDARKYVPKILAAQALRESLGGVENNQTVRVAYNDF